MHQSPFDVIQYAYSQKYPETQNLSLENLVQTPT